jgi:glycosyltransferase involved in cell wall biosynthesis
MGRMKKKIIYIGNFSFPYGNAAGARVIGNGLLFRELGYETIFVGLDNKLNENSNLKDTKQEFKGFEFYNFPYPKRMADWLMYNTRFIEIKPFLDDIENLYAIICYGSPTLSLFNSKLLNWAREKNVKFLADCADLLFVNNGNFIHRIVKYLDEYNQKRILNFKADGVIVISSFLQNFYRKKKTVVIPPLINPKRYENINITLQKNDVVNLIYVGKPFPTDGRRITGNCYKDRLDIVVEALYSIQKFNFVFKIYGLTKKVYLQVIPQHTKLLNEMQNIIFMGEINNETAINNIAKSDFTIFFRDVNRMTSAGFPTKFVETISCGTPIITTDTSDLYKYLEDGKNGFFIDIDNIEILKCQLIKILNMDKTKIVEMKEYCYKSHLFSYQNFNNTMQNFLNKIN